MRRARWTPRWRCMGTQESTGKALEGGKEAGTVEAGRKAWASQGLRGATVERSESTVFPFNDKFVIGKRELKRDDVRKALLPRFTEERVRRLVGAIAERTFSVVPIAVGAYDLGNFMAICRSAESFGFGEVGLVSPEGATFKQTGRTSAGAAKWLETPHYNSIQEACGLSRKRGYRIFAAEGGEGALDASEVDWTVPTVVLLGNEREGFSQEDLEKADGTVKIPIVGMTESLNVSVAAACLLYHAFHDRRSRLGGSSGDLSSEQRSILVRSCFPFRSLFP